MPKREREFSTEESPCEKKVKYDNQNGWDHHVAQSVLLHSFYSPSQIITTFQGLSQLCLEQYEEIQYIQLNWTDKNWASAGGNAFKLKTNGLTHIAHSLSEFQEREYLLNQMNENVIYSAIHVDLDLLSLHDKQLTRFPVAVLSHNQLTAYWAQLTHLFLGHNRLVQIPAELSNLKNLTFLSISNNHLINIPTELAQIKVLKNLYLAHNHLSEAQLLPFVHQYGTQWLQDTLASQTHAVQTPVLKP